ncbi:MAG: ATP-dependent Clp protease ATP-binding subunit ClpX, partial [Spirochaetales bacterium]|nr:ATP-dependent Clp protease ATP-binding subunit ClpX [Spirochaetales bacterium]
HMHPDDLIHFGLIPEFIGRLPINVTLSMLKIDDLKRIITEPKNSIIRQYQSSLKLDNVDLVFEDNAIDAIAQQALDRKTGARGLRSIVENTMLDIMFDIPSMEGEKEVRITKEVIEDSAKPEVTLIKKTA